MFALCGGVMPAIGSDFVWAASARKVRCSECSRYIAPGVASLVSIRNGRVQKRVCSDECRLEFENNYWQQVARERKR